MQSNQIQIVPRGHVIAMVLTVVLVFLQGAPVSAQPFPERSLRFVVPLAPGGGNDTAARVVGGELSKRLGQQIVVDNRPGGGSVLASQLVLSQPADGYTLYLFSTNVSMAPLLRKNLPFDTLHDFSPMSRIGTLPGGLVVHPSLPAHNVKDLILLAKARPGEIAFSSSGPGGGSHLGGELFNLLGKIKLLHVPYKGSALATTSILSGETQIAFITPTSSLPYIRSGRLRLIAVTTGKRWPLLPDVPTINESGVSGYEHIIWNGVAVRSGTPQPIFDRLYAELIEVLKSPRVAKLLAEYTSLPSPETPQVFMKFLEDEHKKWLPVVKQAGLSAM